MSINDFCLYINNNKNYFFLYLVLNFLKNILKIQRYWFQPKRLREWQWTRNIKWALALGPWTFHLDLTAHKIYKIISEK